MQYPYRYYTHAVSQKCLIQSRISILTKRKARILSILELQWSNSDSTERFFAINTIHCEPHCCSRFECLFCTRAKTIDSMRGFISVQVLEPQQEGGLPCD